MNSAKSIKVLITGAAGRIASSMIPLIANGLVFGENQRIILHLLEVSSCMKRLKGIEMEIEDSCYRSIDGVVSTDSVESAFKDIDWAIFLGGFSAKSYCKGYERRSLLSGNVPIFMEMGKALDKFAKKTVKSVVVSNPANTNALILSRYAPSIPKENFSCLSRLDYNRAIAVLAKKLHVRSEDVKNVAIWGNHSRTLIGDVTRATVKSKALISELKDDNYIKNEFNNYIRNRFYEIVEAKGTGSNASTAEATKDHIHNWVFGTALDQHVSMGVFSDGNPYGFKNDVFFSFPVTIKDGNWKFVDGYKFSEEMKKMLEETQTDLQDEKENAEKYCE